MQNKQLLFLDVVILSSHPWVTWLLRTHQTTRDYKGGKLGVENGNMTNSSLNVAIMYSTYSILVCPILRQTQNIILLRLLYMFLISVFSIHNHETTGI